MNKTNPSNSLIKLYLTNIIKDILPRRIKRLIYLSSIFGLLEHIQKDPDLQLIEKLNKILQLAENPNSYVFPIYVKSLIWRNVVKGEGILLHGEYTSVSNIQINRNMGQDDKSLLADYFTFKCPEWLKYGSQRLMENDVVNLIDNVLALKH